MGVRITSWNVNGIRNPFGYQPWREKRTFEAMFDILEADIVVMQETKIQRKDLQDDMVLVPGWDVYFSLPKHKKGYAGVAIYTRNATSMGKRVILTGDLNVIRSSLDTSNLFERLRKEGMTVEDFFSTPSRRLFNQLVFEGHVRGPRDENRELPALWDLGRLFHPTREGMFTCWDTKKNTRPANVGSRIDYVLCSDDMKAWFEDSNIQEGLMGSDHCPVYATMKDLVNIDGEEVYIRDIMNPPGVFKDGIRLRDWTTKDLLPLSAKLIPEFDRRRSIKDMFFKKPAAPKTTLAPISEPSEAPSQELAKSESLTNEEPTATPLSQPESVTSAPSPAKPRAGGLKRTPSGVTSASRPQKKAKATLTKEPSSKGQSSLMGFFKPKTTDSPGATPETKEDLKSIGGVDGTSDIEASIESSASDEVKGASEPASPGRVFDPIESKESWSKLLGKRVMPKCEHGEDCISLVTKKAGVNRGLSSSVPGRLGHRGRRKRGHSGAVEHSYGVATGTAHKQDEVVLVYHHLDDAEATVLNRKTKDRKSD
ncbi:hypothetical protein ABKA04_007430 [Annulohypoxylon sp. FPYF3050]